MNLLINSSILLVIVSIAHTHSWVERLTVISDDGSSIGPSGFPRGNGELKQLGNFLKLLTIRSASAKSSVRQRSIHGESHSPEWKVAE